MVRRITIALTTLALASGVSLDAQADRAAQVLAAARAAIGGPTLDTLKTFSAGARLQRVVSSFQMSTDLELLLELPDKYVRSEISTGGPINMSVTNGFNGDRPIGGRNGAPAGGMVIRVGPGGSSMPTAKLTPEQQAEANASALRGARGEVSRLMLGWFAMAHPSVSPEYTYAAVAESPDGKADVIDVKGADGFAARLFVDQQTHLPLMVTYQGPKPLTLNVQRSTGAPSEDLQKRLDDLRSRPPELIEYRLYFSDWADADGIRFPRKIQRESEGTTVEEWAITKIKVNPKIDPKKFDAQS